MCTQWQKYITGNDQKTWRKIVTIAFDYSQYSNDNNCFKDIYD